MQNIEKISATPFSKYCIIDRQRFLKPETILFQFQFSQHFQTHPPVYLELDRVLDTIYIVYG